MTVHGVQVSLKKGDITKEKVDVIVNSSNAALDLNTGKQFSSHLHNCIHVHISHIISVTVFQSCVYSAQTWHVIVASASHYALVMMSLQCCNTFQVSVPLFRGFWSNSGSSWENSRG